MNYLSLDYWWGRKVPCRLQPTVQETVKKIKKRMPKKIVHQPPQSIYPKLNFRKLPNVRSRLYGIG